MRCGEMGRRGETRGEGPRGRAARGREPEEWSARRGVPPGCLRFEPTSCNPGQRAERDERRETRERVSGNLDRLPLQIGGMLREEEGEVSRKKEKRGPGGGGGIQTPKLFSSSDTERERGNNVSNWVHNSRGEGGENGGSRGPENHGWATLIEGGTQRNLAPTARRSCGMDGMAG